MSYEAMDHAGWVQANIGPGRRMAKKPARNSMGQAVGWHAAPDQLNRFQARAMDILGIVFGGIYNAPILWDRVEWMPGSLHVPVRPGRGMATWDFADLTRLVFLAHTARIRVDIAVHGRGWMIGMWPRSHQGGMSERHPNLHEALADFEKSLPADSPVRYRPEQDDPMPGWQRGRLESLATGRTWLDLLSRALGRGDRKDAERAIGCLVEDAGRARVLAAKLGGGPELEALVAQAEAHVTDGRARLASMIPAGTPILAEDAA